VRGFVKLVATEAVVTAGVLLARWVGEQVAAWIIDSFDVEGDDPDEA
jgi:hypothetical protein